MKHLLTFLALPLLLTLCGCYQVKDELTLQPDGSGTIRLEVETAVSPNELGMTAGMFLQSEFGGAAVLYPPVNESEASQFFPSPGFTVEVAKERAPGKHSKVLITARFKDMQTLLASRYAQEHQLSLEIKDKTLSVRGKTGMEAIARAVALPLDKNMRGVFPPAVAEARRRTNEMRAEFRVNLPNAATAGNGRNDEKSVTWLFEHAKCASTDEFAAQVSSLLQASCSAEGITFTLPVHARLGLLPFAQLSEGEGTAAALAPAPEKIQAAMRFNPHTLHVNRMINLSGHDGGKMSIATLAGEFIIPMELAPPRWGLPHLTVATDAKGTDLLPKEDDGLDSGADWRRQRHFPVMPEDDEEEEAAAKPKERAKEIKRPMQVRFRAPEWKVKEIGQLKGSIALLYPRAGQIFKLTNAIPEKWVTDRSANRARMAQIMFEETEPRQIRDPRLAAAGLSMQVLSATSESGALSMTLMLPNPGGGVLAAQVFDKDGKPWSTLMTTSESRDQLTLTLGIPGRPPAPLSLALIVSSSSAAVEFPFELQHVPIDNN